MLLLCGTFGIFFMMNTHSAGVRGDGGMSGGVKKKGWSRASKSDAWSWILCLRTNSVKGVLIRCTKDETGSQVSWDGP